MTRPSSTESPPRVDPAPPREARAVPRARAAIVAAPRFVAVDRMRGLAILLVVGYHLGPLACRVPAHGTDGWLVLPRLGLAWLAVPLFHFGFVGVHAFFVVSGFCIHLRAARRRHDPRIEPPTLRSFFLRRFFRIHPPYWVALALFGLAVPLVRAALHEPPGFATARDLALHATMLHGLSPSTIFSINPSFWSLSTEEQFYLAYPILLALLARLGAERVLVASLLLAIAFRAVVLAVVPPDVAHFMQLRVLVHGLFVPRYYEWILGCLVAEAAVSPARPLASRARPLALLGAFFLALGAACRVQVAIDQLLADACFSTGWAAILAALVARDLAPRSHARVDASARPSLARRLPPALDRALRLAGRRSYAIYLVHQPILDAAWLAPFGPLAPAGRLVVALVASAAFGRWCEAPWERRAQRVGAGIASDRPGNAIRDAAIAP